MIGRNKKCFRSAAAGRAFRTPAEGEQIIAAPTLIKNLPLPLRRFIGDMSHTGKILLGLDLRDTGSKPE